MTNAYLVDFTEGFCGLPYLFQSSLWKVCIPHPGLTAFGDRTCKGEEARGVASHGFLNNREHGSFPWGRKTDNRVVSSFYY